MTFDWPSEVTAAFRAAARDPIVALVERRRDGAIAWPDVERLLPHRDPFRFIDEIVRVDRASATIVCRYDPARAESIAAGHFPGRPVWPGVLQVEAIGQAGLCLLRLLCEDSGQSEWPPFALTHILGAEFMRPVAPEDEVEIVARVISDGLFNIVVGQCLQHDMVCCAAAVRGFAEEKSDES